MSEAWVENTTAFGRVRSVANSLSEPRSVSWIAEEAHIAENTARNHLERLAELDILTTVTTESGVSYYPDPIYARSQDIRDFVQNHTESELGAQAVELQETLETLRERYEAESPTDLRVSVAAEEVGAKEARERLEDAADWEDAQYRLSLLQDVLKHYDTYTTLQRKG